MNRALFAGFAIISCIVISCAELDPKEINVKQGNKNIPSGGSHNFGITIADGDDAIASEWIVFTIESSGTADITINDISISGGNSDDFDLDTSTLTYTIGPQKNTTFSIRFDPLAIGSKTARMTIENNDADEGSYTITITGTGIEFAPEINVKQGATDIPDGTGSYDFGTIDADGPGDDSSGPIIFKIENVGNEDLAITDISLSGGDTGDFTLNDMSASPIGSGSSTTFTITFDPLLTGSKSATVTIRNNDPDEDPYEFIVTGNAVSGTKKIMPSDKEAGDRFGFSVAIYYDTGMSTYYSIVGAPYEDGGTGSPLTDAGAAYIFTKTYGNPWDTGLKIGSSDLQAGDCFGYSVAMSGNYAIVGAPFEAGGAGNPKTSAGAAYIFYRSGQTTWESGVKIVAPDSAANDLFGCSVAISGDYAIVGASREDGLYEITDSGSAYVFHRTGQNTWECIAKAVADDPSSNDYFGHSVSIDGEYAIVGAYNKLNGIGAAYVFHWTGTTTWDSGSKITASTQTNDNFGYSVSISGAPPITAIVGAPGEDITGKSNAGAIYIFTMEVPVNYIRYTAPDAEANGSFGWSVSTADDYIIAGAPFHDGKTGDPKTDAGASYRYTGTFFDTKLVAPDNEAYDEFGYSVSTSGYLTIIGADKEDGGSGVPITDAGAVYIFN